jgi:transcription initiation factor IIE alpha subunit
VGSSSDGAWGTRSKDAATRGCPRGERGEKAVLDMHDPQVQWPAGFCTTPQRARPCAATCRRIGTHGVCPLSFPARFHMHRCERNSIVVELKVPADRRRLRWRAMDDSRPPEIVTRAELRELVRLVAFSFLEPPASLLLDLLARMPHGLSVSQIRHTLMLSRDELNKSIHTLRQLQLIAVQSVHLRSKKPTMYSDARPSAMAFFYIDFPAFVDCVRYRIHMVQATLSKRRSEQVSMYTCPTCDAKYTTQEFLTKCGASMRGFGECVTCRVRLLPPAHRDAQHSGPLKGFNDAVRPLETLLAEICKKVIPRAELMAPVPPDEVCL